MNVGRWGDILRKFNMSGTTKVFSQAMNCEIRLNVFDNHALYIHRFRFSWTGDKTFVDVSSFAGLFAPLIVDRRRVTQVSLTRTVKKTMQKRKRAPFGPNPRALGSNPMPWNICARHRTVPVQ